MSQYGPDQVEQLREIGAYLRQQRLLQSLSLEQIAASTFIRLPILQALEEGRTEQLPEPIYVRGFIRRYGELLHLDGQALASRLSQGSGSQTLDGEVLEDILTAPPSQSEEVPAPSPPWLPVLSRLQGLGKYGLYLILLAGAVAGLSTLLSRPPAAPPPQPAVKPTPAPPVPQASPTPVKTSPLSVTVKLDGDSWLRVEVDGQAAYEGVLTQGTEKTWTAQKQLKLRAGNAGAVSVSRDRSPLQRLGNPGEVKEVTFTPENLR